MATVPERVLVKLSGEALMAPRRLLARSADPRRRSRPRIIAPADRPGFEIARRDRRRQHHPRRPHERGRAGSTAPTADSMGMLGTVMNSLALETRARTRPASPARTHVGGFDADDLRDLRPPAGAASPGQGQVVVLAGGTGNPFFTTDTAAVLRAAELRLRRGAEGHAGRRRLFGRPQEGPDATRYDRLTHDEAIAPRSQGDGHGRLRACAREPACRSSSARSMRRAPSPRSCDGERALDHRRPLKACRLRKRKPVRQFESEDRRWP